MFKSLRVRLTLLFLVLMLIPLIAVGASIAQRGFSTLESQAIEFQGQLARQTAINLGAFFSERQNELSVLTDITGIESMSPTDQRNLLLSLLSKQPAYYELTLIDADGDETERITRGEIITRDDLTNRSNDPLFQQTIQSRSIQYNPVYFNEQARDRLITVAVPVEDLFTGEISNVLVAEIRFQNVQEEVLRSLELTNAQEVYIVDANGIVIAHRNPSFVLRETQFNVPAAAGRHIGLGGDDVLLATETISLENLELTVVSQTTYASATAIATNSSQITVAITGIALIGAAIIITIAVSRVVNPIVKISRVAEAIQSGDLNAKAEVRGGSEIATLAKTFNSMTAQLQSTLSGLRDNIDQLEKSKEERERLIKDLQAAKRLAEENSRLKSEFLSTMSHELRTPMNAIEGFTGIMLKRMGGVDYNPAAERFLTKVQSNSSRLLNLINDFLDLSRIESGRLDLAQLPISPALMAQKWYDDLSVLAEKKGIAFTLTVDPELPATIYGDEESLSKIAGNLLSNAFKFTSEGEVSLELTCQGDDMVIEVRDTGIGIPPHAREFIFDEFRQVDQSSKRQYGGTGLGLAIVQKLARAMNGTVTLESEVGKGSAFTVLIPIRVEQPQYA
jgi:signal transduction histidine kinase